jgi:RimJ/RimL family protein N-acetyltransferase
MSLLMPDFETERLIIREYTSDDLNSRHRLMVEAFGGKLPRSQTESWLDWTIANYRELGRLYQPPYGDRAVILRESGATIGSVGVVPSVIPWGALDGETNPKISPEFGLFWAILPEHWGKGYAPEAAQPLIGYIFSEFNAQRIVATTEHDNLASQRVMLKLGMTIKRNPGTEPGWFQVLGVLSAPR